MLRPGQDLEQIGLRIAGILILIALGALMVALLAMLIHGYGSLILLVESLGWFTPATPTE